MNETERDLDLALAECEQENRLLRARNDRLSEVYEAAKVMVGALQNVADFNNWDRALTRLENALGKS